ncbi:MAG: HlyD family secretion protein [Bdellovibrionaceae bacterium]|nr:HlyD family secretion protein [Pseudobdellovibrionaceae bacterium]
MSNSGNLTMERPIENAVNEEKDNVKWWQSTKSKRIGTALLVIAVAGTVMWRIFFYPFVSTDDARVAMTVVRAASFGTGGRIIKVNVEEGSRVKAGDVLVELDHRVPQAKYDRAKAKADFAEKEFQRMQQLFKQNTVTPQNLDNARSNYDSAKADLNEAEVALENTFLKSPFDGVVIQKVAEVGNILEAGQTALTVADADHAWISANIEETSVGLVKIGQHVHISVDEGGELQGKISEVRSATASQFALIPSDNAAGNFTKVVQRIPVKVALEAGQGSHLRVGQSVEIKVRVH